MAVSVVLLVVFALSIAYATFIENDKGTEIARELVYNALWFEFLLVLLVLNLFGSVYRYELLNRKKFTVLLIHLSFVVILLGAGITRYFGSEGIMHIREGQISNELSSNNDVLRIETGKGDFVRVVTDQITFDEKLYKSFHSSVEVNGEKFEIIAESFLQNVRETIVPDVDGKPAISLFVMNSSQNGSDIIIDSGEKVELEELNFKFTDTEPKETNLKNNTLGLQEELFNGVKFEMEGDKLFMYSHEPLMLMQMMEQSTPHSILPNVKTEVKIRTVYRSKHFTFVVKSFLPHASRNLVLQNQNEQSSVRQNAQNAVVFKISNGISSKRVNLMLSDQSNRVVTHTNFNGISFKFEYGKIGVQLPFSLELRDFQLDRYAGSNSPSSFASELTIIDNELNTRRPYRIYMNNVLNYRGYRFFQASYDEDEKGTVLSVSDDYWGTFVSYIGYLMLLIAIVLNFFNSHSRFRLLTRLSIEMQKKRSSLPVILLLMSISLAMNASEQENKIDFQNKLNTLLVQDPALGRIEPFITFSSDVLRKLSKKKEYNGQSAPMVVLQMIAQPELWKNEPVLVVKNSILASELGAINGHISFNQLFDFENGGAYRISEKVSAAYHKDINLRNTYDKEIIYLDERVNISYLLFQGQLPKCIPITNENNSNWMSAFDLHQEQAHNHGKMNMAMQVFELKGSKIFRMLIDSYNDALNSGNWSDVNRRLDDFKTYQKENSTILPSDSRISVEVFYNKLDIFGKLAYVSLFIGIILLAFIFWNILNINPFFEKGLKIAFFAFYISFGVYTLGLIMRWYISQHAPWSNGYETMLFVGWATMLSGLVFAKSSPIALALTGILASIALITANMSWMNPEITNLVPVLKSYWLIIHVAVITASYGFLAMGALIGLVNLILMIVRVKINKKERQNRISSTIQETSVILELSLIIGLLLLTIGCFLGGVWANESWGRYWGWDPKETWALVSILVYSAMLHLRSIPKLNNPFVLNTLSMLSFSTIIMTFVGVNYYLSGMHSYGNGTPPPVPGVLYIVIPILAGLIFSAWKAEKKFDRK